PLLCVLHVFCITRTRHTISTLFPYTTLFRSLLKLNKLNQNILAIIFGVKRVICCTSVPSGTLLGFEKGNERTQHKTNTDSLRPRSEEHTSELQSRFDLVCRLLLEKKKQNNLR